MLLFTHTALYCRPRQTLENLTSGGSSVLASGTRRPSPSALLLFY